jgi:hypothetical protein
VITPDDLFQVAGILYWNLEIPLDFKKDESVVTKWLWPTTSGEKIPAKFVGINFQGIPPGTVVKIFLWVGGLTEATPDSERLKYCLRYKTRFGKNKRVFGKIDLPKGYDFLSSHEPSGTLLSGSGDNLISLYNDKTKRECDLHLEYGHKSIEK